MFCVYLKKKIGCDATYNIEILNNWKNFDLITLKSILKHDYNNKLYIHLIIRKFNNIKKNPCMLYTS